MFDQLPQLGQPLSKEHIEFLKIFTKSCRRSIIQMVTNAQSGHPGGSLSCIDYLSILYTFIISQTGEKVTVSNGHISPGVYSTLAEMGYIPKQEAIKTFRKIGSLYEGHVTRHVDGVDYGTGPLGIGVSVASAFAMATKLRGEEKKSYALMGDGEAQEGQVHEMINFAKHHKLNNLILFVDYNKVQLSDSLEKIINIDIVKVFLGGGWHVIEVDGHDYQKIWTALSQAQEVKDKPVVLVGHTIMGHGIDFMEENGKAHKADWHGKAPKSEQVEEHIKKLQLSIEEEQILTDYRENFVKWQPKKSTFDNLLKPLKIDIGTPLTYPSEELTDCRTAYGKALLDLATLNKNIIALTADLKGSVMTKFVDEKLPQQHIECGIAEQHMVSASGGFSLDGFIPFCSTFGAFMTSRAKDQARVNDINDTNVKMVATHCGLSVGEDGPTHQSIDDAGSFLGLFNTMVIEPADPNQTDRIIRYIASHYGNFYVRMGRHKFPVITKEDGSIFYEENYQYEYGRSDIIREGKDLTIAATGAAINEALKAREMLLKTKPELSIEIVAVTSIKKFDETLISSIKKTKKVITVEDHNPVSGLGGQLAAYLKENDIETDFYKPIGVTAYQFSGQAEELYHLAGIDAKAIKRICLEV